jgi:hypothetical protein
MTQSNNVSTDLLISLATAPLLVAMVGGRVLAHIMREVGQASEEIFRGDRLPILHMPTTPEDEGNGE